MEYGKMLSISGIKGLFELISTKNDGSFVRSLEDKSTKFYPARLHTVSQLEGIEVYTQRHNVPLAEVFMAMQNNASALPEEGDAKGVRAYFEKVYPEMDFERVYASDMKKMVRWFGILKASNVEIKLPPQEEKEQEEQEQAEEIAEEPKPAKKENIPTAGITEAPKAAEKEQEPVAEKTETKKLVKKAKEAGEADETAAPPKKAAKKSKE